MSFETRSWADIMDDDDEDEDALYESMVVDYAQLQQVPIAPPKAPSPPPPPKTHTPPPVSKRATFPEDALAAVLQQARAMCQSHGDRVELELRLGRRSSTQFDSGVPRTTFEGIMAQCRRLAVRAPRETHETSVLFSPAHDARLRYRATLDAKSKRVKNVCEKIHHRNLDLPTAPFDVRLSLASENKIDVTPSEEALASSSTGYTRNKQRWSFQLPLLTGCCVDLTRVVNSDSAEPVYEVEIEFDAPPPSAQQVQYTYDTLFATLFDATTLSPAFLDIPLLTDDTHMASSDATAALYETLALHSGEDGGSGDRAPPRYVGSMPVTFLRHYITRLCDKRQPYFVAEKTDGERYLLFARAGMPALLVNRSMAMLPVATTKRTTFSHPIVLDGEMVRDVRSFEPVFLVFDVLAAQGHVLLNLPFAERHRHLAAMRLETLHLPFKVAAKRYHPLSSLKSNVFKAIRRHPLTKERLFYDDANALVYRTDGVIFQPNTPYRMGTDYALFKYKYADELTVEFAARYAQRDHHRYQLCLSQRGQRQHYAYRTYRLDDCGPAERSRLVHLLGTANAIGEFRYDTKLGRWVLVAPRYDKRNPNVIDILVDTLELLTQKITPKQLVVALAKIF